MTLCGCTYVWNMEATASPHTLDQESQHVHSDILCSINQAMVSVGVELKIDWRQETEDEGVDSVQLVAIQSFRTNTLNKIFHL